MFLNNDSNQSNLTKIQDDEMALSEHIEEFSQRLIFCLILLVISTLLCFTDIRQIVQIFQIPAVGIKFLQFAPFIHLFRSMEIVYRSMGEFEEADAIRKRAEYIYPTQYLKIYGKNK